MAAMRALPYVAHVPFLGVQATRPAPGGAT
jgi:hypothetical protein